MIPICGKFKNHITVINFSTSAIAAVGVARIIVYLTTVHINCCSSILSHIIGSCCDIISKKAIASYVIHIIHV